MSNVNLKPLQTPCLVTRASDGVKQRWAFSGKPLTQQDVDNLTNQGLDWIEDVMPDGRLKLPKFRLRRKRDTVVGPSKSHAEINTRFNALVAEYAALEDDPKPDFMEWAAGKDRQELYRELITVAHTSKRPMERLKAIGTLLEFTKSKPKQVLDLVQHGDEPELSPEQLLSWVLELNGIDETKAVLPKVAAN